MACDRHGRHAQVHPGVLERLHVRACDCVRACVCVCVCVTQVMDLLNKMFELDEKKRIDIKGIMDHPWYRLPMRKEYTEALDALEAEQRIRDQKVGFGFGIRTHACTHARTHTHHITYEGAHMGDAWVQPGPA